MPIIYQALVLAGLLAGVQVGALAATAVRPVRDDEVLEVLQTVTRNRPVQAALPAGAKATSADPAAAARQARQDISVARQTGDTRYWANSDIVNALNKMINPVFFIML